MKFGSSQIRRAGILLALLASFAACAPSGPLLLPPTSTPEHERIDNLPMYGQPEIPRPEFLKKADQQEVTSIGV